MVWLKNDDVVFRYGIVGGGLDNGVVGFLLDFGWFWVIGVLLFQDVFDDFEVVDGYLCDGFVVFFELGCCYVVWCIVGLMYVFVEGNQVFFEVCSFVVVIGL